MSKEFTQSDAVKKAVKWISTQIEESGNLKISRLVEQASFRFNLSPKDTEFLIHFYQNSNNFNAQK